MSSPCCRLSQPTGLRPTVVLSVAEHDACGDESISIVRRHDATSSAAAAVLAGLGDIRQAQEEFYRDLHQQPELSHQEHRAGAAVAERLERAG
jgi:hypothetical protein